MEGAHLKLNLKVVRDSTSKEVVTAVINHVREIETFDLEAYENEITEIAEVGHYGMIWSLS